MKYNPNFLNDLHKINEKIDNNEIYGPNNALDLFSNYLKQIICLGRFNPIEWNKKWRDEVYEFGTKFKKIDPVDFLKEIDNAEKGLSIDELEVLDFIKYEIKINILTFDEIIDKIKGKIKKYPFNPEFRHNLGHIYKNNGELLKAIEQYEFAVNKDERNNTFLRVLFNTQYKYIEASIEDETYEKGIDYVTDLLKSKRYKNQYVYSNLLLNLKERLKDYQILNKKILNAEIEFERKTREISENERKKVIELLGFFSAIIAFIFSTISISNNFSYEQAITFSVSLGFVLLIFLVTINILFTSNKKKILWFKFILLIILIVSLLFALSKYIS